MFILYTPRTGVIKITPDGKLSYVHKATDGHWICLDQQGAFSNKQPKYFQRITPDGVKPAIFRRWRVANADGNAETILKSERPWSPTGVALHNGKLCA